MMKSWSVDGRVAIRLNDQTQKATLNRTEKTSILRSSCRIRSGGRIRLRTLSQWATRMTIRAPTRSGKSSSEFEPPAGGQIEADHVGEDDDVEQRHLALERPETLLEEDPPADGLHLPGVDPAGRNLSRPHPMSRRI